MQLSITSSLTKFSRKLNIVGMIHMGALPGTPRSMISIREIAEKTEEEACLYREEGLDAVLVENMHDIPYVPRGRVGPEITAAAAVVCSRVREACRTIPVGLQLLAGANEQAVAVAHAAELDFVRVEGYVFAHVADEGLMDGCAGDLLRFRRAIGADNVHVWADIKKKHSAHAITSDVTLRQTAEAAAFFSADAVIVTGEATGKPPSPADITELQGGPDSLPVVVGSGATTDNLESFRDAHAIIVGSYFKKNGHWAEEIDRDRVKRFMDKARDIRSKDL